MSLILILKMTSANAQATNNVITNKNLHIAQLDLNLEPSMDEDFKSYKVTPLVNDHEPGWEDAQYFPGVPGRSICESPDEYRWFYDQIKSKKVYQDHFCDKCGPDWVGIIEGVAVGILLEYARERLIH